MDHAVLPSFQPGFASGLRPVSVYAAICRLNTPSQNNNLLYFNEIQLPCLNSSQNR